MGAQRLCFSRLQYVVSSTSHNLHSAPLSTRVFLFLTSKTMFSLQAGLGLRRSSKKLRKSLSGNRMRLPEIRMQCQKLRTDHHLYHCNGAIRGLMFIDCCYSKCSKHVQCLGCCRSCSSVSHLSYSNVATGDRFRLFGIRLACSLATMLKDAAIASQILASKVQSPHSIPLCLITSSSLTYLLPP